MWLGSVMKFACPSAESAKMKKIFPLQHLDVDCDWQQDEKSLLLWIACLWQRVEESLSLVAIRAGVGGNKVASWVRPRRQAKTRKERKEKES